MGKAYINQHGRRPTRGIRPWLLLPKVLSVAVYLGSLAAVCVVWFTSGFSQLDTADPRRFWTINLIGRLMRFLAIPALVLAIGFGIALLLQHPRTFLRLRWLQVKLACAIVAIPASHFYLSSRLALLRAAAETPTESTLAATQFGRGLLVSFGVFAGIAVLGRLKPRLGQDLGRTFAALVQGVKRGYR